ncbi:zinc finger protein 43-like [Nymphalis io]|uniref:zinc finger protein 43-like n=1 Tax=Inachis io TaxID=171585 RepID=UPI0021699EA6|nr:zinc finger protein 43-like [Nymphalis io]
MMTEICCGCLNNDRRMVKIEEYNAKKCFLQIINEIPNSYSETPLQLCYECAGLLFKFTKYKQQVLQSYKALNNYVQIELTPYRNLETKSLFNISTPYPQTDEIRTIEVIKTEFNTDEYLSDIKEERDVSNDDEPLIRVKKRKKKNGHIKKEIDDAQFVEVELSKDEILEEIKQLALREDYVNAMFQCEKCVTSFPNADDLADHISLKHKMNSSKYKCTICECSFSSEVSYNYHTNKHTRRYQCVVCSERFVSKRGVLKHYNMVHCHRTNVEFDYDNNTDNCDNETPQHQDPSAQDDQPSFPCEFCGKTFKWRTSLRKHLETHRIETGEKRKPYCAPCRLSFTTTSNLQKHVRTSSKHQIQLKLRKLTESLPELTGQDRHKAQLEIRKSVNKSRHQFPCTQCDRRFLWRGNLLRHMNSHAAKANGDLICKPCNRTFSSIATYQQHMKISKKHVSENDFKFMCSDCGKRFPTKSRLRDHINWEHLKNYVYSCDECQKVFKTSNSVYHHKQVHKKDVVEHLCDHCGKPFPNQAKLRSHILGLHSRAAAHKCGTCGARFSWHSCLSRHVRQKHANKKD